MRGNLPCMAIAVYAEHKINFIRKKKKTKLATLAYASNCYAFVGTNALKLIFSDVLIKIVVFVLLPYFPYACLSVIRKKTKKHICRLQGHCEALMKLK